MNDWALLQEYLSSRSEEAFSMLVGRHIQMVHGTALRQVRDPHAAEDVTQAVFILFAKKASRLSSGTVIGGWLYRTACLVSLKLLRDQRRREAKERQSAMMLAGDGEDRVWEEIAPHVDEALMTLSTADRDGIVLRFIEQRSFREVAEALRISEEAAKKRVSRALERLRVAVEARLGARGVTVTGAALMAGLAASGEVTASEGLARLCVANSIAGDVVSSTTVNALVREMARESWKAGTKWALGLSALSVLLMVGVWQSFRSGEKVGARAAASTDSFATPAAAGVMATEAPPTPVENPGQVQVVAFRVLAEENGAPLPGAEVISILHGTPSRRTVLKTDADGIVRVTLPSPEEFKGMSFWAGTHGRVPKNVSWREHEALSLPREYSVKLALGNKIAGRVIDEDGNGVEGAKLLFNGSGIEWNSRESVSYNTEVNRPVTDNGGYWEADFLAADTDWIGGRVEHPDYAITTFSQRIKIGELTNYVWKLERGGTIAGTVQDPEGRGVTDVALELQDLSGWRNKRESKGDLEGKFEIDRVAKGEFRLRATARGHKAADVVLKMDGGSTNVFVQLKPEPNAGDGVLRGRVLDANGAAASWVTVGVVWTNNNQPQFWTPEVDSKGRFEWQHAPAGILKVSVSAFETDRKLLDLAADGTEHEIRLPAQAKLKLSGEVIDGTTRTPIRGARLMLKPKVAFHSSQPEWLGEAYDGKFEFVLLQKKFAGDENGYGFPADPSQPKGPVLMVEAENYRRVAVQLAESTNDIEVTVEMQTGNDVVGRVIFRNQLPAAGTTLAFGTKTVRAYMSQPGVFEKTHDPSLEVRAIAAADGTFDLGEAPFNAERVLAVQEEGWANVAISSLPDHDVVLNPWSRVEGVVRVGKRAGERLQVQIGGATKHAENMSFTFFTDIDETGRFRFEKVPGGVANVSLMHWGNNLGLSSHTVSVAVPVGGATNVVLGGSGVRVSGRVVPSMKRDDIDWGRSGNHLQLKGAKVVAFEVPAQSYGFFCEPDGSFEIEGVLPGDYRLILNLTRKGKRVDRIGNERDDTLAHLMTDVTIGSDDVDLGVLSLKVRASED